MHHVRTDRCPALPTVPAYTKDRLERTAYYVGTFYQACQQHSFKQPSGNPAQWGESKRKLPSLPDELQKMRNNGILPPLLDDGVVP